MDINKKKIRVLHLLLSLEIGGMEKFVYENCLSIDKNKFEVSVCCIDRLGGFYDRLIEHGIHVDLLKKNQKKFDWFFAFKLSKYLNNNKIDILHIHTGAFFHGSIAGLIAKVKGVIYTEHGRHYKEPWQLYILDQISARCVDQIITVSEVLKKHLIVKMRFPAKKVRTIINGVNTDNFIFKKKPEKLLKEFSLHPDWKIVGTIGRLAEVKDQATLIKAFQLVKDNFELSKLFIVGDGPSENDLKKLVDDLGLKNDIIFTGDRFDIPDILNIFDVFVLTSLMEGTSISLLEAMASGVPCIATDVGGNTTLIKNGVNGFLFPVRDHYVLSKKIIEIINNQSISFSFSKISRSFVEEQYSLKKNMLSYQSLYQALAQGSSYES